MTWYHCIHLPLLHLFAIVSQQVQVTVYGTRFQAVFVHFNGTSRVDGTSTPTPAVVYLQFLEMEHEPQESLPMGNVSIDRNTSHIDPSRMHTLVICTIR
jgi:hypothetical protein